MQPVVETKWRCKSRFFFLTACFLHCKVSQHSVFWRKIYLWADQGSSCNLDWIKFQIQFNLSAPNCKMPSKTWARLWGDLWLLHPYGRGKVSLSWLPYSTYSYFHTFVFHLYLLGAPALGDTSQTSMTVITTYTAKALTLVYFHFRFWFPLSLFSWEYFSYYIYCQGSDTPDEYDCAATVENGLYNPETIQVGSFINAMIW